VGDLGIESDQPIEHITDSGARGCSARRKHQMYDERIFSGLARLKAVVTVPQLLEALAAQSCGASEAATALGSIGAAVEVMGRGSCLAAGV